MDYVRSLVFNSLFWITAPFWVVFILVPLSFLKSPASLRRGLSIWFEGVFFLLDKISGIKIVERGLDNIPKNKGFILCSKHMSNLEALIIYRRMPNLTALAKIELFRVFGFKQVLNKMEVIAIDRGKGEAQKKTPDIVRTLMTQKIPLLLFAEGTRIPVGKRKDLKSGVYYIQKGRDLPVICASTNSGAHWLKGSPFNTPGTVIVEYHPAIDPDLSKEDFMAKVKEYVVLGSEKLMGIEGKD